MRRIDPADLAIVLAIGRHRSFRKAAVELRMTPSALSHALRALETRLDIRLFNRTTRAVALTQAGARLFDRIQPAFQDIDDALRDLVADDGAPIGSVRINAAHAGARLALMPLVAPFLRAHPSVTMEIVAQNAMVNMVGEGFDAGVRLGETVAADMVAVRIGQRQRFAAVGSPEFFERWAVPTTPRALKGVPCVRHRFDDGGDYHWEFEQSGVELAIAVDGPFTTNSQDLMIMAALDGIGIAFVLEGLVREQIEAGRLLRVLEDWCPSFAGLFLYYPGRRQVPSALRAFIDFVR